MRRGWLAFFLFAAGVALIIVAICWSLYAYGQVGQSWPPGLSGPPAAFVA